MAVSYLALAITAATAQTKPAFEVASIKPTALDMAKLVSQAQSGGGMPRVGPRVEGARAEYIFMSLRDLIVLAYKVKAYQITGPNWLNSQRFDIVATLPEGTKKDDVPAMLQALLEDRFKLTLHRETKEGPVLGLVVGKGGPKLKQSAGTPKPLDLEAPLGPGERIVEGADGPMRMKVNKLGSATLNMGERGTVNYSVDPATRTMKIEASMVTMTGFADMLTALSQATGAAKPVRDMTGLAGNYEVEITFLQEDLLNMARAQGMPVPNRPAEAPAAGMPGNAASDPSGSSSSLMQAVQSMGLKLESRKAMVEHLVIDKVEKAPTEN